MILGSFPGETPRSTLRRRSARGNATPEELIAGVVTSLPGAPPPSALDAIRRAARALESAGWVVEEVTPPELTTVDDVFVNLLADELGVIAGQLQPVLSESLFDHLERLCRFANARRIPAPSSTERSRAASTLVRILRLVPRRDRAEPRLSALAHRRRSRAEHGYRAPRASHSLHRARQRARYSASWRYRSGALERSPDERARLMRTSGERTSACRPRRSSNPPRALLPSSTRSGLAMSPMVRLDGELLDSAIQQLLLE